jgi:hypothetical protein
MHSDGALLIVHIDGASMALCFHVSLLSFKFDIFTSHYLTLPPLSYHSDLTALEIRFLDVSQVTTTARRAPNSDWIF